MRKFARSIGSEGKS